MRRLWFFVVLLAVAALSTVWAQWRLAARRPVQSPMLAESAFAALGGFRALAAEVVWFRADRLQEEGRYVELAQLASMLTFLEPHTPEVWCYSSWNLAYNVAVMMATDEDRWRWVLAGIRLLRDEGLLYNPDSSEIHRELAWLFELKLCAKVDAATPVYRAKWKELVSDVRRRGAWHELAMNPMRMMEIERQTGFTDWSEPALSAIYWAAEGLRRGDGKGKDYAFLREIIRQASTLYLKNKH